MQYVYDFCTHMYMYVVHALVRAECDCGGSYNLHFHMMVQHNFLQSDSRGHANGFPVIEHGRKECLMFVATSKVEEGSISIFRSRTVPVLQFPGIYRNATASEQHARVPARVDTRGGNMP